MPPESPIQYMLSPLLASSPDLTPLNVIRTETVLSKLPIHSLAKKGYVEIGIVRRSTTGQIDLKWEVSYSSKYGPPRQLAYKLDTLVVNRRIDERGRPVPRILRLGSLSQICAALDLPASGRNTNNVKKAILQNAGSLISAKLSYNTVEGAEKRLEAIFTRYSVVFTGERLPNGQEADGVYLVFTDPYWEVLNKAPVRPLNYDYLKALPPAPQRFYEIVSYRIFVALKYEHPHAKLAYSDYCAYSAQQRYFDYDRFKKQMYKVHRPHLRSGYISKVVYETAGDSEGRPDWIMYYEPGPRARAEFTAFESGSSIVQASSDAASAQQREIIDALVERGITAGQAQRILRQLKPGQPVLEQLRWGDHLIAEAGPRKFYNPPGFYIYLLKENIQPPERRHPKPPVTAQSATAQQARTPLELELAYDEYRRKQVDLYLEDHAHEQHFQDLVERKRADLTAQYRSLSQCRKSTVEELAASAARGELQSRLPLMTFTEFCRAVAETT